MQIKDRIRGYLPVVVDIETSGFNEKNNALLEICAIIIDLDEKGNYCQKSLHHFHIKPFDGAIIEASALKFNGIQVDNPFRQAVSEEQALNKIFNHIEKDLKHHDCNRAILVGHNAFFDLSFLKQATLRAKLKSPFHQFSTIDTVSLSALCYGQTVLAKSIEKAGIDFDNNKAHSALYDTQKTAELFCQIFNNYKF